MFLETTDIRWNSRVQSDFFRLGLNCDPRYASARPGQFVTLHLPDQKSPLLRRPFSIHRLLEDVSGFHGIEILYKVVGEFTRKLSKKKTGESISLLGPLGNGFSVPSKARRIYLAAGGVGVAPLCFLMMDLRKKGFSWKTSRLFLGGKTRGEVLEIPEIRQTDISIHITTDDGSYGDQCLLTSPLETAVRENPPDLLIACGPTGMLACVAGIAGACDIPCQVSLETMMACGIGVCLGCAVPQSGNQTGYSHACIDGPVFDSRSIVW